MMGTFWEQDFRQVVYVGFSRVLRSGQRFGAIKPSEPEHTRKADIDDLPEILFPECSHHAHERPSVISSRRASNALTCTFKSRLRDSNPRPTHYESAQDLLGSSQPYPCSEYSAGQAMGPVPPPPRPSASFLVLMFPRRSHPSRATGPRTVLNGRIADGTRGRSGELHTSHWDEKGILPPSPGWSR